MMNSEQRRRLRQRASVLARELAPPAWVIVAFIEWLFIIYLMIVGRGLVRRVDQLNIELANLRDESRVTHEAMREQLNDRIQELERVVFVEVQSDIDQTKMMRRPITPAEAWQRQRDAELRRRLTALEQWRLKESK